MNHIDEELLSLRARVDKLLITLEESRGRLDILERELEEIKRRVNVV